MTKSNLIETSVKKSGIPRIYWLLPLLMVIGTLFYYFGELIDYTRIEALRWQIFYSVHDIHRMFFLAPIIYAGYVARVKGAVIVTLVTFMIFMPRALFFSPYPDPALRAVLFTVIAGSVGVLTGISRNEAVKRSKVESILVTERDRLMEVMEKLDEGVLIIGPDYKIRFVNPAMKNVFGEGIGALCYRYFGKGESPCEGVCKLPDVLTGNVEKWRYDLASGKAYEIISSPYTDTDGTVCQLAIYRDVTKKNI
jgi:PAS domain-containing protein